MKLAFQPTRQAKISKNRIWIPEKDVLFGRQYNLMIMFRTILLAASLFISAQLSAQTLKTTFSGSWDRWEMDGKTFKTVFSNDYGSWENGSIRLKTTFSNDWDNWSVGNSTTLKTTFSDDFDRWEVRMNGKTVYVKTTFSDDYDRWDISGDATGTMRTTFSDDYSRWDIQADFKQLPEEMKSAVIFVAIFTSFRQNKK